MNTDLVIPDVTHGEIVNPHLAPRDALALAWIGSLRSPHTVDAYRRDLREFFAWCDDNGFDVLALRQHHIDGYRHWLTSPARPRGACQSATEARKLTSLSSYYGRAVREGVVLANPVQYVSRPTVDDESLTDGLDLDEARHMIAAAKDTGAMPGAFVHVLLATGVRVSEACAATTSDLGMARGHHTLTVTRKGGKRQRIPLIPDAWADLNNYLAGRPGPLFLSKRVPLYRQEAYRLVIRVAGAAGIQAKKITPHSLRHTAATLALDAGVPLRDVQQMLGHRDPRTTNRYDRARDSLDRSAVHALGAALAETVPHSPAATVQRG